jgi:hypothetical protein
MRQPRSQRVSTPETATTPVYRAHTGLPASGYELIVDGQAKANFTTHEQALKAARELKGRFPMLQVKVYDAEKKFSENIGLIVA